MYREGGGKEKAIEKKKKKKVSAKIERNYTTQTKQM